MIIRRIGIIVFCLFVSAFAYSNESVVTKPASQKGTNLSFEDLLVKGKYQFSTEEVVTVEEDKVLDELLSLRENFNDRLQQSQKEF